jgi:hypothetical protein
MRQINGSLGMARREGETGLAPQRFTWLRKAQPWSEKKDAEKKECSSGLKKG